MIISDIDTRIDELKKTLSVISDRMADPVAGHLRVSFSKQYPRYYQMTKTGDTKGRYLRKDEIETVRKLAQQDYCSQVILTVNNELKILEQIKKDLSFEMFEDVYSSLSEERRKLVIPIIPTDEMFIAEWLAEPYTRKPFDIEDNTQYYTNNGVRMRSKSELLIGNALESRDIPYLPEFPVLLSGYGYVFPDFYILNVRLRKVIIWEHHGLLDESDYRENNFLRKNELYLANGYMPGDNLIQTFESRKHPLGTKTINTIINKYLV